MASVNVSLKFEPRDLWVGLYWDRKETLSPVIFTGGPVIVIQREISLYICFLPCFPLVVRFRDEEAA